MIDGSCDVVTEAECTTALGIYKGDGNTCPANCSETGACCKVDGSCEVLTEAGCVAVLGDYKGDGVTCPPPGGCPQPTTTGACCMGRRLLSSSAIGRLHGR
jgi:hypothetical protein